MQRAGTVALATFLGAAPGLVLVALAALVITGEMQLTVGAPGILLAVAGGVAGLVFGLRRAVRAKRAQREYPVG